MELFEDYRKDFELLGLSCVGVGGLVSLQKL